VLFFFFYGGLEASAGLWAASYLVATKGVLPAVAGTAASVYWAALTAGRVAAGAVAARAGEERLVRWSCVLALAATAALCLPARSAVMAFVALAVLGLALASIYPLTMHLTPHRHGPEASARQVGYQVAACSAGIALLPWAVGALAAKTSLLLVPPALAALAIVLNVLERRLRPA
jgi:fucose permease